MDTTQTEMLVRLPTQSARKADVPYGTQARKSWQVKRRRVIKEVLEGLTREGGPRLVGLVGASESGKATLAAEIVRSTEVLEFFADGIVWLLVDDLASDRLDSLTQEQAKAVHEHVARRTVGALGPSGDGAVFVKESLSRGHHRQKGRRCLVVADYAWEEEVVAKQRDTGMWILLTARSERLVEVGNGKGVNVDQLSDDDAVSILRGAAELPACVPLPDAGRDIINLCGRAARDVFVRQWGGVYKRKDSQAWSHTACKIRKELEEAGSTRNRIAQRMPKSSGVGPLCTLVFGFFRRKAPTFSGCAWPLR